MSGCGVNIKHLVDIKSLATSEIEAITTRALELKKGAKPLCLKDKHAALMFFENSTRTHFSFEMALNRLGVKVYNFDTSKSSFSKGEDFFDTLNNLSAIGFNTCIIRTKEEGLIKETVEAEKNGRKFFNEISLINAGTGVSSHPTQALLDFVTIKEKFGNVSGLNLLIVGDIKHSRVAKSNIELLTRFGVNIKCLAPGYFRDETVKNVTWCENLFSALENTDIVIALRIQGERIEGIVEFEDYIKNYQLSENNFPKKNCVLMHPGPVNRDVELTSGLLEMLENNLILTQAQNGVYARMALLETVLGGSNALC